MKYAWIDTHRRIYGLVTPCAVLGVSVSVSGYQAWKRGGTLERNG